MRLEKFRVQNYRNIQDSGWINLCDVTAFVGQNEAGKSNLFEALYCINPFVDEARYDADEDWPVDDWKGRANANGTQVCEAEFVLNSDEIESLYSSAKIQAASEETEGEEADEAAESASEGEIELPNKVTIRASRSYGSKTGFEFIGPGEDDLNNKLATAWAKSHLPKFVYIHDYEMTGAQVELDELKTRWDGVGRNNRYQLDQDDQTILVILDLAQIDLDDFLDKGKTTEGRTVRSFDKRSASAYLTNQFQQLWKQKKVKFDIEIDGPTLNIFATDEEIGMPVRLKRRSTGFRWYVSFAWKFTHASGGEFKDCILLLEEPGIHLHYDGQRDLLEVFDKLSETNTVLYTTHLASMVDLANPERIRIVESVDHHLAITEGVVSKQQAPMAVIETSLGLTPDLSGMLGNRKLLIVEGGTDALILNKLSGLIRTSGGDGISDQIYLWPAQSASKTPMYAAFAIGQEWDAAVLLDSDEAGNDAKSKIEELSLKEMAGQEGNKFRVMMLRDAASISKTDAAIEDLFPDNFYLGCVNEAYGLAIQPEDLPVDGSDEIAARVEHVLKTKHNRSLDKKRVLSVMLKKFDSWNSVDDLPGDTLQKTQGLIDKINQTLVQS